MPTLIVSVEGTALLAIIKAAKEQLRGVASVTDGVSYDATDCDAYREAVEDVKAGSLPSQYRPHKLGGKFNGQWENAIFNRIA